MSGWYMEIMWLMDVCGKQNHRVNDAFVAG